MRDRDTADEHGSRKQGARRWSRRQALTSLAAAGTLGLAGCSLSSVTPGVQPLWERDFAAATAAGPPAATDEHVLVGGQDKQLHGFTADGERILTVGIGGPIETRPAVPAAGGPVHVHGTDGDLYTADLSGARQWQVEGRSREGWLGRHGSLVVSTTPTTGTVTGYDARSGTRRFQRSGEEYPFPVLSDAVCIFPATDAGSDRRLMALDPATGETLWTRSRDGYPYVVAAGDRVVTVRDSTVRLRRGRDGHVLWETTVDGKVRGSFDSPVWLGDHVYVRVERDDASDAVVAIDRAEGTTQWRQTVGYELETVTTAAERTFVASSVDDPDGGILVRLDAFGPDGTREWKTTTDIEIGGTVNVLGRAGEVVFVASDSAIAAYEPDSGTRRWRYDPDAPRLGVTAADGALYVSRRSDGGVVRLPTG